MVKIYKYFVIILLFSHVNNAIAQGIVDITSGFGFPELLNGGFRFQIKQVQLGVNVGSFPNLPEFYITIGSDLYYHFGKHLKFSERRPWYGRGGLIYQWDESSSSAHKFLYLNLRLGRDINFSKKVGINIDLGLIIELLYKEEDKDPHSGNSGFDVEIPPVLPSGGISFFFRI